MACSPSRGLSYSSGSSFAIASTRQLQILNSCNVLGRFDYRMRSYKKKTIVAEQQKFHANKHTLEWLVKYSMNHNKPKPRTRKEWVVKAIKGSLKMQFLLSIIERVVLKRSVGPASFFKTCCANVAVF
jgi:hypothetical protein